jgi:hypothetical protein
LNGSRVALGPSIIGLEVINMVKKVLANLLFYLMITALVFAISLAGGYASSFLVYLTLGIEVDFIKVCTFFLLVFTFLAVCHLFDGIIERLKGMSE